MNHKLFATFAMLLLLPACAAQQIPLSDTNSPELSGRTVYLVREAKPSFQAITSGKAMVGPIGALVAAQEGTKLVETAGIEDPSQYIEQQVAKHLRQHYRTAQTTEIIDFRTTEKPSDLSKWAAENKVNSIFVDVETTGWGFLYYPTVWSKYRVMYSAVVKLIDVRDGKTIAQYQCSSVTKQPSEQAPTKDQMLANNAALLKAMLKERADVCLSEVKTKIL